MTRAMNIAGLLATSVIIFVLGVYTLLESGRQERTRLKFQEEAVHAATDSYAENCALCHGAAGEGIGATPPLNTDGLRSMDYETLFRTVAWGRYGTSMGGWSTEAGGVLTSAQVDQMITLIQAADWNAVNVRVAELGMIPPTAVQVEVSEELLIQVSTLPGGNILAGGLTIYAEKCAACHGANAEGTSLAPALNNPELISTTPQSELVRIVTEGVPSTLMAGWSNVLTPQEIEDTIVLVTRWPELEMAGVELPTIEIAPLVATPEMIAQGEKLFSVACTACHGANGLGTPMAPALNNVTFLQATPDPAIAQIIAQGVTGTMMPAWGGRLSEADINAIVVYLRSLEASAPVIVSPQ